jgi:hypothetical protein
MSGGLAARHHAGLAGEDNSGTGQSRPAITSPRPDRGQQNRRPA